MGAKIVGYRVMWVCPECETVNFDNYQLTACPGCSWCDKDADWWKILSKQEMETLNLRWKAEEAAEAARERQGL